MLPHFVWADFADVVADLKSSGLPVELDWFRPHFEFRFPLIGSFEAAGLTKTASRGVGSLSVCRTDECFSQRCESLCRSFLCSTGR